MTAKAVKYVGDLSKQDAVVLERYARNAYRALEFGVGGSTQIIAQTLPAEAAFWSLDTDAGWITTTQENLRRLGVGDRCQLRPYEDWIPTGIQLDFIFDDGVDRLRRDFAFRSFPRLAIGGVLLFHDTRRLRDVQNVLSVIEGFFDEIESVNFNERVDGVASNITVVRKKAKEPYVNWNAVEQRPPWAYGQGAVPDDFWRG